MNLPVCPCGAVVNRAGNVFCSLSCANRDRARFVRLTPLAVLRIRHSDWPTWKLADFYGVSSDAIWRARTGRTWHWLEAA
jgi:hypothetical protein